MQEKMIQAARQRLQNRTHREDNSNKITKTKKYGGTLTVTKKRKHCRVLKCLIYHKHANAYGKNKNARKY